VARSARWSQSKDLNSICFVSREDDKGGLKVFFKMALKPERGGKKGAGGWRHQSFQVPVLGGTFAAVPGTQLLGGERVTRRRVLFFHVSAWLGVINILKDRIFSPGLK